MTSLLREIVEAVRRRAGKALTLLALMAGIAGGAGLYVGIDGFFVWVTAGHSTAQPLGIGEFPRLHPKTVTIPLAKLSPSLAQVFRQGMPAGTSSIPGFVFRNSGDTNLCLAATTTGPLAGENQDPVGVRNCDLAPNEIWIPEQWETEGTRFTWLVNYKYQSKCLNADHVGGLTKGEVVQLWDCYPAGNEAWDFGDWYQSVSSGTSSYPIYLGSGSLCLDADKFDLRDGTAVHIWDQYDTATQFWS